MYNLSYLSNTYDIQDSLKTLEIIKYFKFRTFTKYHQTSIIRINYLNYNIKIMSIR